MMPRARMKNSRVYLSLASWDCFAFGLIIDCENRDIKTTEGWNTPVYSLNRWLSRKGHHWATILRFLPTIWFVPWKLRTILSMMVTMTTNIKADAKDKNEVENNGSNIAAAQAVVPPRLPRPHLRVHLHLHLELACLKDLLKDTWDKDTTDIGPCSMSYWQAVCSSAFVRRVSLPVSETESIKIQTLFWRRKGHLPCQGPAEAQRPLESSSLLRPWPFSGLPTPSLALAL